MNPTTDRIRPGTIQRFGPDDHPDQIAAAVLAEGVAIIERAAPVQVMSDLLAELQPHVDATPPGTNTFAGRNTRRVGSLLARSPSARQLAAHPLVLAVCDRTLGPNAPTYQLHLTQLIDIGPDEPAQQLHRDQWAWDHFPFPTGFEVEVSTIWAANDFTEANGATRVIPGSNRWADDQAVDHDMTVAAAMPAGSVVVYTGSVFHGGGANRSEGRRAGVNIDYCLGWLRQEENQYLSCPPDVARTLPIDLARLAGYRRAAYALGYFGDLQDPIEALHPTTVAQRGFS
jgi:ectoine hydroxylase-related dioxygenase (phytanoyl-CoA dioxygenase family)